MSDTGARLRNLFETIAPPIEISAVMSDSRVPPYRRRGWAIAVAAAGAAVLVGVGGWLLVAHRGAEPPVITNPPVTTTTAAPITTTTPAGRGLDALAAFHAGPVPPAATCPTGSTPDVPGDPEAAQPVKVWPGDSSAAFDRQSGLLVEVLVNVGQAQGVGHRGEFSYATWTFDPCWNRWQEMRSSGFAPAGHLSPLTYDADSDRVVAVDEVGTVWAYDTDADVWTSIAWSVGKAMLPNDWPATYHNASGLIVFYDPSPTAGESAWAYDVDTDARYEITPMEMPAGELVYDPVGGRYYVFTGSAAVPWRWEPGIGWVELSLLSPAVLYAPGGKCGMFDIEGGPLALDEATGRFIVFCRGAAMAAFDPATAAWEALGEPGPDGPNDFATTAVYDSANGRLILTGGWYEGAGGAMWAYDGRTGKWIELLAAVG